MDRRLLSRVISYAQIMPADLWTDNKKKAALGALILRLLKITSTVSGLNIALIYCLA